MNFVQWQDRLAVRIRAAILVFMLLLILDNSTLFDLEISQYYQLSSNLSTWLSAQVVGLGFVDSFSFPLVGMYFMILLLLFGAIRAPYRNFWVLQYSWLMVAALIAWYNYTLFEDHSQLAVGINAGFQSLKLVPLGLACYWTKQLELPLLI